MTTKYAQEFKADNPTLPLLRTTIENVVENSNLSEDQINALHDSVSKLILETVPELVFIEMSDSFLWEGGFEECSKQMVVNLKKIGIEDLSKK